jgi:multicomponent Na+:H+ antiporter subunit D
MAKIWAGVFWGEPEDDRPAAPAAARLPRTMVASTAVLVVVGLAVAVGAGPLAAFAERAASDLLDPGVYVEAVMGR